MTTLYVLGNGFDAAHKLETSYTSFRDWDAERCILKSGTSIEKFEEMMGEVREFFAKNGLTTDSLRDWLWNNLEEAYGNVFTYILQSNDPEEDIAGYSIRQWIDALSDIQISLFEYIRTINKKLETESISPIATLSDSNYYLTFNYTLTLEQIYGIHSHVLHIHGIAQGMPDSIIFGHGINQDKVNFDKLSASEQVLFATSRKYSNQIIKANEDWFTGLHDVTQIKVMGHSLSGVDFEYFKYIADMFPSAPWTVYIYELNSSNPGAIASMGNAAALLRRCKVSSPITYTDSSLFN